MPLQRQILRLGDLRYRPRKDDLLLIQYTGWIYDAQGTTTNFRGRQFDSTAARGAPLQYPLGAGVTIKGWEMALPQMSLGEKSIWIISADLAYGKTGLPPAAIAADTDLIFEIELLAINGRRS